MKLLNSSEKFICVPMCVLLLLVSTIPINCVVIHILWDLNGTWWHSKIFLEDVTLNIFTLKAKSSVWQQMRGTFEMKDLSTHFTNDNRIFPSNSGLRQATSLLLWTYGESSSSLGFSTYSIRCERLCRGEIKPQEIITSHESENVARPQETNIQHGKAAGNKMRVLYLKRIYR